MSSQTQQPVNQRGWRWTHEQQLLLVTCLAKLRRDGHLKVGQSSGIQVTLRRIQPLFKSKWPDLVWDESSFYNRFKEIRLVWKAFEDLHAQPGVRYDDKTGRLHTTEENWKDLLARHNTGGPKLKRKGLAVGANVTMATYAYIYNDEAAGGCPTRVQPAIKTSNSPAPRQAAAAASIPVDKRLPTVFGVEDLDSYMTADQRLPLASPSPSYEEVEDEVEDGDEEEEEEEEEEDETEGSIDSLSDGVFAVPPLERRRGRRERSPSNVLFPLDALPRASSSALRRELSTDSDSDCTSAKRVKMSEKDDAQTKEIMGLFRAALEKVTKRPRVVTIKSVEETVEADTIIDAVQECCELLSGREDDLLIKACRWLKNEPRGAAVFKALPKKEFKIRFLEKQLQG